MSVFLATLFFLLIPISQLNHLDFHAFALSVFDGRGPRYLLVPPTLPTGQPTSQLDLFFLSLLFQFGLFLFSIFFVKIFSVVLLMLKNIGIDLSSRPCLLDVENICAPTAAKAAES